MAEDRADIEEREEEDFSLDSEVVSQIRAAIELDAAATAGSVLRHEDVGRHQYFLV